jgi:hypothetical protein
MMQPTPTRTTFRQLSVGLTTAHFVRRESACTTWRPAPSTSVPANTTGQYDTAQRRALWGGAQFDGEGQLMLPFAANVTNMPVQTGVELDAALLVIKCQSRE